MRIAATTRIVAKAGMSEAVAKIAPRLAGRQDVKQEKFSAARWPGKAPKINGLVSSWVVGSAPLTDPRRHIGLDESFSCARVP
jgi:hypothetical protein